MTLRRFIFSIWAAALSAALSSTVIFADETAKNTEKTALNEQPAPFYAPWGVDLTGLDTSVRPGDDYFKYANGNWTAAAVIAPGKRSASVLRAARQRTSDIAHDLVQNLVRHDWPEGSDEAKFKAIYKSYLDRRRVNRLGRRPIRRFLSQIDRSWSRNKLMGTLGSFRLGAGGLFAVRVRVNPQTGQQYLPSMEAAPLLLGSREVYLSDAPEFVRRRQEGTILLAALLKDVNKTAKSHQRVSAVIALETRLAALYPSLKALRDPDIDNQFVSLSQLKALEPRFDWENYLLAKGVGKPERIHLRLAGNLNALVTEFEQTPLRVWRDYLRLRLITTYGAYLSDGIAEQVHAFEALKDGVEFKAVSKERRAGTLAMELMPDVIGRAFITTQYAEARSEAVMAMAEAIRDAYRRRIEASQWLTAPTKQKAIAKLDAVGFIIGGPSSWNHYGRLPATQGRLFENVYWARQIRAEAVLSRLDRSTTRPRAEIEDLRSHLFFSPLQVGAYYVRRLNTVIIPASYLQTPFYDPDADIAVNFGALGTTIGHELGHAFDDQGAKYGPEGQLVDWWSPEDRARFEALGARLGSEFSTYRAYQDINVDPQLTLGESLSDLAGLEIAYEAYRDFAGLTALSPAMRQEAQKRFLLGYAQKRRSVRRPGVALELALTGVHAPPEHPVNGIVPHLDVWYEAYGITPEHALWRAPQDRIKVW